MPTNPITDASVQQYAEDNADADGCIHEVTLVEDMEVSVKWTSHTWEDGAPVTKMIERSSARKLFLPAGTKLKGVAYTGRASGCQVFDFPYGSTWYSARRQTAKWVMAGRRPG